MPVNDVVLSQLGQSASDAYTRFNTIEEVAAEESGFNGLSAEDFMKMLIAFIA